MTHYSSTQHDKHDVKHDGHPVDFALSCPIPIKDYPVVTLAHGGGGKLMNHLIEKMFLTSFHNEFIDAKHDGAVMDAPKPGERLAFSTDSYVVKPIFFPGGDIGSLAINGTVNDLSMCGAAPKYLSVGFIIEEGFPMQDLWRVIRSMSEAAKEAGVLVVTGDTKVVDKGKGDGIFINTAGIGVVSAGITVAPSQCRPGDRIVLSGDVGRHGTAIIASREGISFETKLESDCAPLNHVVRELLDAGIMPRCMRDLTRGGLATALVEIAGASGKQIIVDEKAIAVREDVHAACEMLGLDPLYVANEGRFIVIVDPKDEVKALAILKKHQPSAAAIGSFGNEKGYVLLKSVIGSTRIIDMLSGEQLPRIC